MRSLAREAVFKYLFSRLFNPSDEGLFDALCKDAKLSIDEKEFADSLLKAATDGYDKYISKIDELSVTYKTTRIFAADKCAIIVGMAELDSFSDIPVPVTVDEAVKISAKYSTEKSTDFVNGILASYAKEKTNG